MWTPRGGAHGHHPEVCLPQFTFFLQWFTSFPHANICILFPRLSGVSSHHSFNLKSKISSSKLGLSADEASGWNLFSTAPQAQFISFCDCVKLEASYLTIPPKMQWWDRHKITAIDRSICSFIFRLPNSTFCLGSTQPGWPCSQTENATWLCPFSTLVHSFGCRVQILFL